MDLATLLPTVNATLNGLAGVLLASGLWAIKTGRKELHRALMLSAFGTSALFLISYATRVVLTGTHRYPGSGLAKAIYLAVLVSHMVLATAVVPLVLRTLYLALSKRDFTGHARIARVTFPVWLYVSVTGVVVYLMLYQLA